VAPDLMLPRCRYARSPEEAPLHALVLLSALTLLSGCDGDTSRATDEPGVTASPALPSDVPSDAPPDVVLVVIDTLRADRLGAYGHDRPTSPAIDALAARGLRFERAYAQSGWTLTSMASLLSGTLPHVHGVLRHTGEDRYGALDARFTTLAEALGAGGYQTGAVLNNSFLAPVFGLNQGFGHYDHQGARHDGHRTAAATVDVGLAWWDQQTGPKFLLLHIMEPHLDYGAPEPWTRAFTPEGPDPVPVPFGGDERWLPWLAGNDLPDAATRRFIAGLYDGEVRSADAAVGALVEGLEQRGALDQTLLVVTSDHGEELFDHGRFEHGHSLRSPVTRVPLIVSGPGISPAVSDVVVAHTDLYQTILAVGQAGRPAETKGQDLRAIAAARPAPARVAVSEGCLYVAGCLSVVSGTRRLVIDTSATAVLRVDAEAREVDDLSLAQQQAEGADLAKLLARIRGGSLDPAVAAPGAGLPTDGELLDELRSLGYLADPLDDAAGEEVSGGGGEGGGEGG
jgi:arylsulfatase A-like enzyme